MAGPDRTRVKICGLTRLQDAEVAYEAGAWALSMVLWPGSPRACETSEAVRIGGRFSRRVEVCGVTVDQPLDEVVALADACRLTMVQLHGDEGPAYCREVARRTGARVVKAARVRGVDDVTALRPFRTDFHLLDAGVADGRRGGTGETFDWSLARVRRTERGAPRIPLILAGGLRPDNVADAIEQVGPFAVDGASGTERAPGVKDHELVRAFVAAVDATEREPEPAGRPEHG